MKLVEKNHHYFGSWDRAFTDPLEIMVYTLNRQEDAYMSKIKGMNPEAIGTSAVMFGHLMKAFTVDYAIYDILGDAYMQVASKSKGSALGQFFTPFDVCEMMARMNLGNVREAVTRAKAEGRKLKVHDPCVGSGAMLLAMKKVIIGEAGLGGLDHFEFYGQDIDQICVNMCKVQMRLTDYRWMSNLLYVTAYEMQRARTETR